MHLLEDIARLSLFLPILLFLLRKKAKKKEVWVIFYFLIFSVIQQIIFAFTQRNAPGIAKIVDFTNPITYLIFICLYFNVVIASISYKKIIFILTSFYIVIQIGPIFFDLSKTYISIITTLNTLIILFFCLFYFYEQLRFPKTVFIYSQNSFWGTAAFLLFSSGTFFVFWYNQIPNQSKDFENQYIVIHASIYILRNLFFSIAMIINPEKSALSDENSVLLA